MGWFTKKQDQIVQRKQQESLDRQRVKECHEMVAFFAHFFGYIARECITREELEQLIAYGISPADLGVNIRQRIENKEGLRLGTQFLKDWRITVKLTQNWRDRHIYAIGRSGSGKTNLLRTMILQDTTCGNGVGILAPEQEMLTEEILPYIAEDRIDDVIYVNPADTDRPIPLNPLHLAGGEDIDIKVDDMLTLFTRLMGDTTPRMSEILYHTFYALMERKGSTLLDVECLLDRRDDRLRRQIIQTSENPRTVRFFQDIYPDFPKDAFLPITTRIGRLVSPKLVRNLLCQPGQCLNFRDAMDEGKILLFNLSDGLLGERTSELLGQLIVSKIQLAVMSRADTPAAARRPFYLYLDEFQTFTGVVGKSYERMLSRARKYKLSVTLAHQQTGQISEELLREIFGNVSTIISFNVSSTDAKRLSHEFQMADDSGQFSDLSPSELLSLRPGEAYIKVGTQSFYMKTHLFTIPPDPLRVKEIIEASRMNYGVPVNTSDSRRTRQEPPPPRDKNRPDPSQVF